jgi:hypothetical protein
MKKIFTILSVLSAVFMTHESIAALNISAATGTSLAQKLFPLNSGLTVGGTHQGKQVQRGTFTANPSDQIGGAANSLTNGIILGSGEVSYANWAATNHINEDLGQPGDTTANTLLGGSGSLDASTVTITVTNTAVNNARITLKYTFATEELSVSSLNDVAYISVDGTVVASEFVFTSTFTDNRSSLTWVYDDYTAVSSVTVNIAPSASKVIKIGIADAGDRAHDSAFFVEAIIEWY